MATTLKVGQYILTRKIGEGAFAEVRLAIDEETGQEYAVKVYDRSSFSQQDFERDVKREIRIMSSLRHPNIVSIHSVLTTEAKLYLVMELVRGGELYDEIVKKRRVDENTARKYFQQLVDAMIYCHQRGVVHRDLKPENVLLTNEGNIKVTDFGMSCMREARNHENNGKHLLHTQCGTPKYMAPEVIARPSNGYDGELIDTWDCGMVLYALLAGHLPFSGDDDKAVFQSILCGQVRFPAHFSDGVKDVLTKLLQKNPHNRMSLSELLNHEWFRVGYSQNSLASNANAITAMQLSINQGMEGNEKSGTVKNESGKENQVEQIIAKKKKDNLGVSLNYAKRKSCERKSRHRNNFNPRKAKRKTSKEKSISQNRVQQHGSLDNCDFDQSSDLLGDDENNALNQQGAQLPLRPLPLNFGNSCDNETDLSASQALKQMKSPNFLRKLAFPPTSLIESECRDPEQESSYAPKLQTALKERMRSPLASIFKSLLSSGDENQPPNSIVSSKDTKLALQSSWFASADSSLGSVSINAVQSIPSDCDQTTAASNKEVEMTSPVSPIRKFAQKFHRKRTRD